MATLNYPKTVAAVQRHETTDLWAIADALLKEVGKSAGTGAAAHGDKPKFEACAFELRSQGFDYTPGTLRNYRNTAEAFPSAARGCTCSFGTHEKAGSPEMLQRILDHAGSDTVSKHKAEEIKKAIKAAERAEVEAAEAKREAAEQAKREKAEQKQREADEAERRAREADEAEKAEAEREAEKARKAAEKAEAEAKKAPPQTGTSEPDPSRDAIERSRLEGKARDLANQAMVLAEQYEKLIIEHELDAGPVVNDVDGVIERWGEVKLALDSSKPRHLEAVAS